MTVFFFLFLRQCVCRGLLGNFLPVPLDLLLQWFSPRLISSQSFFFSGFFLLLSLFYVILNICFKHGFALHHFSAVTISYFNQPTATFVGGKRNKTKSYRHYIGTYNIYTVLYYLTQKEKKNNSLEWKRCERKKKDVVYFRMSLLFLLHMNITLYEYFLGGFFPLCVIDTVAHTLRGNGCWSRREKVSRERRRKINI